VAAFNSLFEMRPGRATVAEMSARRLAFNSLFEMLHRLTRWYDGVWPRFFQFSI